MGDCYRIWKLGNNTSPEDMPQAGERLLKRMDQIVGTPWGMVSLNECQSGCNVTRNLHHDRNYFPQRFATVLVYLTSTEGGHTLFPLLQRPGSDAIETKEQAVLRETFLEQYAPGLMSAFPPQQMIL